MAQQTIGLGASPNDGTGDTLRDAGAKINANFTELYGIGGAGNQVVSLLVTDPNGSALTTGDGKAFFRVPDTLDGMSLVAVAAAVSTVSSSGAVSVALYNVDQADDLLTTNVTIDASEKDSKDAATPAVTDTAILLATGDQIRVDIDGAGTGAKGLMVEMQFAFVS